MMMMMNDDYISNGDSKMSSFVTFKENETI